MIRFSPGFGLPRRQLAQAGPLAGAQQARLLHLGAAQSHDALGPQRAGGKELTAGYRVLIANVPDRLGRADRIEKVDVGAGQSRGMRAGKFDDLGTIG